MAARHRDSIPPYEIMGPGARSGYQRTSAPTQHDSGQPDAPASGVPAPGDHGYDSGQSFWATAAKPLVLRVPRGLAVLILLGLLGAMVLTYWVGHSRGQNAAETRYKDRQKLLLLPRPPLERNDSEPGATAGTTPSSAALNVQNALKLLVGADDPRQEGLNYLILARYPKLEAQGLAKFLISRQLDAIIVPSDNARLVHVVARRGFRPDQGQERKEFRNYALRIGRLWKAENGDRGDDLSSMYFDRYEGE